MTDTKPEEEIVKVAPEEAEVPLGVSTEKGRESALDEWRPKTEQGKLVKEGKIASIDVLLQQGKGIREPEIVDYFFPSIDVDLFGIGQSKGKFGGGKRTIWRQTQKKTAEGNKPSFTAFTVVGNKNGYVGIGLGKARETVPAREKSLARAKLSLIRVLRGCGSFECGCRAAHSIPCMIKGRSGSVTVVLQPAPRGTGIVAELELRKLLGLAGITDVYANAFGQTRTKINLIQACFNALVNLGSMKIDNATVQRLGVEGVGQ